MAVYKRRTCTSCKTRFLAPTINKKGPEPCDRCGAPTTYSPTWFVGVRVTGADGERKESVKGGFKDKAEAQAYETKMLHDRNEGAVVDKVKDTSFEYAAKEFLEWAETQVALNKMAEGHQTMYESRTRNHLLPYFSGTDLRAIDHDAVDRYIVHRQSQPFYIKKNAEGEVVASKAPRPATINREVATLKKLVNVAIRKKIITHNPIASYELPHEDNERDMALTHEQVDRLLKICKERKDTSPSLYMAVFVALHTGMRHDNVVSLEWSSIDFDKNEISVVVKHQRRKGPKIVNIPMTKALVDELKAWRREQSQKAISRFVFPSPKKVGAHILVSSNIGLATALRLTAKSFLEDGKKEEAETFRGFHFHDFRHTFATLFLDEFPDKIEILREILGHSSSYMTRRYAHITKKAKHRAMETFSIGGGRQ